MQAGALEVFAKLLSSLTQQQDDTLLSSVHDDSSDDDSEAAIIEEMWSAAVGILSQVVMHNPEGSKQILQVHRCKSSLAISSACHHSNHSQSKHKHVNMVIIAFVPINHYTTQQHQMAPSTLALSQLS